MNYLRKYKINFVKFENFFRDCSIKCYKNNKKVLLVFLIIMGIALSQLPKIVVDTSPVGMLHKNDASLLEYKKFHSEFGLSDIIVIAVKTNNIFNNSFLKKFKALHDELEREVPYLNNITSLINAKYVHVYDDKIHIDKLLKGWPEKDIDFISLRKHILNSPVYLNNIISEDEKFVAIIIDIDPSISEFNNPEDTLSTINTKLSTSENIDKREKKYALGTPEIKNLIDTINKIIDRYDSPNFEISSAGELVLTDLLNRYSEKDTVLLMILGLIFSIVLLFLFFHRLSGAILPITIVIASIILVMGLLAFLDISISPITSLLPIFIIAVGIADAVHLLNGFYSHFEKTNNKEESVSYSFSHNGFICVITSFTTILGLLSFSFSDISDISEMGIFSAIGVFFAILLTIILLPVLLAVIPVKNKKINTNIKQLDTNLINRMFLLIAKFSNAYPKRIFIISLIIIFISLVGVFHLQFSNDMMDYFHDGTKVEIDNNLINEKFKGSMIIEAIIDTNYEYGIFEPDILNRIEKVTQILKKINGNGIFVGSVFSINDSLKEIHEALNGKNPAYYIIPQDKKIIAQEFFLLENSDMKHINREIDNSYSKTRISIKVPWADAIIVDKFCKDIDQLFKNIFQDKAKISITGLPALLGKTFTLAQYSMAKSYLFAFVTITFVMIIFLGSLRYGILSIVPNLMPILFIGGLMGFCGIYMDLTVLLVGSITLGIIVDNSTHFIYNFKKYFLSTKDVYISIKETLLKTGRALFITSIALIGSFSCLIFSALKMNMKFGLISSLVIFLALIANLILCPSMLVIFYNRNEG